jgi:hypothetical protein
MKRSVLFAFLLPIALAFTPYFPSLPNDARQQAVLLLMVCTLLVLATGLIRGGWLAFAVVAVALPLTYVLLFAVSQLGGQPPAGDRAVGYALYTGYPKSRDSLYVPLLVGVPILIAFVLFFLHRRRLSLAPQTGEIPPPVSTRRWSGVVVLALLILALACYFWPDVCATCPAFVRTGSLQWDSSNVFVWQYLFHHGALPWKDFWYPYGGQILFALDFPLGDLVYALHRFLLFTLFLLATYALTGRSIPATLAIFGTLFGLAVNHVFDLPERYGLVVNVVLTYLAIDRTRGRLQMEHLLFWLASLQAVVFEPASVLYAGGPLLISFGLDALRSPAEFWLCLPGRMLREFVPVALSLVGVGSFLAVRGQLWGFLDFMGSLDTMAAYSAVPVPMLGWLGSQARPESFLLAAVVVLLGVGLCRELTGWKQNNPQGRVARLLGLATAGGLL